MWGVVAAVSVSGMLLGVCELRGMGAGGGSGECVCWFGWGGRLGLLLNPMALDADPVFFGVLFFWFLLSPRSLDYG